MDPEAAETSESRARSRTCPTALTESSRFRMTRNLMDDPEHWRARAEEARVHAEQMKDPETRRMMLGIAESYEQIARRADERLRDTQKSK